MKCWHEINFLISITFVSIHQGEITQLNTSEPENANNLIAPWPLNKDSTGTVAALALTVPLQEMLINAFKYLSAPTARHTIKRNGFEPTILVSIQATGRLAIPEFAVRVCNSVEEGNQGLLSKSLQEMERLTSLFESIELEPPKYINHPQLGKMLDGNFFIHPNALLPNKNSPNESCVL